MVNTIFIFFMLLTFTLITPNAIHALLALILLFINFSILLFSNEIMFLAFAYILVYVGAISVLFLYIILLLNLRTYSVRQRLNLYLLSSLLFLFLIAFIYLGSTPIIFHSSTQLYQTMSITDLQLFASHLFESHQVYMLFAMLLLLVSLILAIFLSVSYNKNSLLNNPEFIFMKTADYDKEQNKIIDNLKKIHLGKHILV
jgi:NADH-quinone oxidoreductase subunit J